MKAIVTFEKKVSHDEETKYVSGNFLAVFSSVHRRILDQPLKFVASLKAIFNIDYFIESFLFFETIIFFIVDIIFL